MRTYHIVFQTAYQLSWRILRTEHDLDTEDGLLAFYKEKEEETGEKFVISSWTRLAPSGCVPDITSSRVCEVGTKGCIVRHNFNNQE